MPVDFTKVPIGTKVETAWGPGKIVRFNPDEYFPVEVSLDSGDDPRTYTNDGRHLYSQTRPSLFLAPFEWPTQEQPEPPPLELEVDAPIMVRETSGDDWEKRHFAGWDGQRIVTFAYGKTSFTAKTQNSSWKQWRLPTEEELKGNNDAV
jgi:hypothetical protein